MVAVKTRLFAAIPRLRVVVRRDWERAMLDSAPDAVWSELGQDAALRERADELVLRKYSQMDYNRKR